MREHWKWSGEEKMCLPHSGNEQQREGKGKESNCIYLTILCGMLGGLAIGVAICRNRFLCLDGYIFSERGVLYG